MLIKTAAHCIAHYWEKYNYTNIQGAYNYSKTIIVSTTISLKMHFIELITCTLKQWVGIGWWALYTWNKSIIYLINLRSIKHPMKTSKHNGTHVSLLQKQFKTRQCITYCQISMWKYYLFFHCTYMCEWQWGCLRCSKLKTKYMLILPFCIISQSG